MLNEAIERNIIAVNHAASDGAEVPAEPSTHSAQFGAAITRLLISRANSQIRKFAANPDLL